MLLLVGGVRKKHPTSRSTKVMKGGHYLAEGEGELLAAEKNLNLS